MVGPTVAEGSLRGAKVFGLCGYGLVGACYIIAWFPQKEAN